MNDTKLSTDEASVLRWIATEGREPAPKLPTGELSRCADVLFGKGLVVYSNAVGSDPVLTDAGRAAVVTLRPEDFTEPGPVVLGGEGDPKLISLGRPDETPTLSALGYTHALNAVRRYDEEAEIRYALAARYTATHFIYAAEQLQYDAAYFSRRARAYRFRLIGAEPEDGR